MSARFAELDWRPTPMGDISLRRRREVTLDVDVYEIRLDDDFLMSSLFTHAEIELARLGLAATNGSELDVVVGGLGLGYTARAVLDDPRIGSLHVVEALDAVVDWHQRLLLPCSAVLVHDPRCHFVRADFFAAVGGAGFGANAPSQWDVVLLDIDHTPRHVLHSSHAAFYTRDGLRRLTTWLKPGGVFALWSDTPPDDGFLGDLRAVFDDVTAHVVSFANHYTGSDSANTVYIAASASDPGRVT